MTLAAIIAVVLAAVLLGWALDIGPRLQARWLYRRVPLPPDNEDDQARLPKYDVDQHQARAVFIQDCGLRDGAVEWTPRRACKVMLGDDGGATVAEAQRRILEAFKGTLAGQGLAAVPSDRVCEFWANVAIPVLTEMRAERREKAQDQP